MKIRLFTLLTAVTLVLSLPIINAMEKDTIKIQTSDEQEFEVSKKLIQYLVTIKHLLEDLPPDSDTPIPVNVDGDTFSKVIAV